MTDFYEVLKLDRSLSCAQLQDELIRLESLWTDRASNRPEKATEMLAVIAQAKKVFGDENARAAYDRELTDPTTPEQAEFIQWKECAQNYFVKKEYDLAKTALEKALPQAQENDFQFQRLAALIYKANRDLNPALEHINVAILHAPDMAHFYVDKAEILELMGNSSNNYGNVSPAMYWQQARETMRIAAQKAVQQSDSEALARADGGLAFLLYFHEPKDEKEAERLAARAVAQDKWGNARTVLEDIARKREAARKAAQMEEERRNKQMQEEAERKRRASQYELEQRQRQKLAEDKKKRSMSLNVAGWALTLLGVAGSMFGGGSSLSLVLMLFVFVGCFLMNYGDASLHKYNSVAATLVSAAAGLVSCFQAATAYYTSRGYSASSASATWKVFLIMLGVYFVLFFAGRFLGKKNYDR